MKSIWGAPQSESDIRDVFVAYIDGRIPMVGSRCHVPLGVGGWPAGCQCCVSAQQRPCGLVDCLQQLPWVDSPLSHESTKIMENLRWLNDNGFFTINRSAHLSSLYVCRGAAVSERAWLVCAPLTRYPVATGGIAVDLRSLCYGQSTASKRGAVRRRGRGLGRRGRLRVSESLRRVFRVSRAV